jgi:hypothetical protein
VFTTLDQIFGQFLPALQILDLSFNDGLAVKAPSVLHSLKHLRSLNLECCGLSSLECEDGAEGNEGGFLQGLLSLQILKLGENEFTTLTSLENLRNVKVPWGFAADATETQEAGVDKSAATRESFPLKDFDCRENEIASEKPYKAFITSVFPSLELLDNAIMNTTSKFTSLSEVKGLKEAVGRCDTLADAAEGSDACSCLEGVPCEEKYKCIDWGNRFAIAKIAKENIAAWKR